MVAGAGLLAALCVGLTRPPRAAIVRSTEQNVLLVTIDTLRADALGCYGAVHRPDGRRSPDVAETPTIDGLAARGIRFDFAHAHAVVTLPSHASILTGLYPFQHGVRENSGYRLPPDTRTLARLLKDLGFATGAFVGAFPLDARFGLGQGFDVYDDRAEGSVQSTDFKLAERTADAVVSSATTWIARQAGRWFVWVHVFDPHAPYQPPPAFLARYPGRPYAGEVAYTDTALAPLIAAAGASTRPTLVVLTADHGESLGDHGETTHGLFAYESTLHVPLIVAQVGAGTPERTRGATSGALVRHVDLLPTVVDALALDVPRNLPGRSLLASADGRAAGPDATSYFEALSASLNRGWAPLTGVIEGREKYIDLPIPELYDVGRDPAEQSNLAEEKPDRLNRLRSTLRALGTSTPAGRQAEDPDVIRRLRALGYVTGAAVPKSRYTEDDDPKRLIDLDRAIHQGIELFQRRRLGEAIEVYRRILSRRPDMEIAVRHLAFVHWETGAVREAIDTLRQAVSRGVRSEPLLTQLGTYLAESGSAPEAVSLLEPLVAGNAADVDTWNALGIAYAQSGRLPDAVRTYSRLLAIDPENTMALENLGSLYVEQGNLEAARAALVRAVGQDPRSARAHTGLGVIALRQGDRQAALASWARAVELDAREYDALFNLALELTRSGDKAAARPYVELFLRTASPALYADDIRYLRNLYQGSGR